MENTWTVELLGNIVSEWIGGSTPNRSISEYYSDDGTGVLWARVNDMQIGVLTETKEKLTEIGVSKIRRLVPKGAILLSTSGTIGKVSIAGQEMAINQAIQAMIFNEAKVIPEYAYFYLQFFQPWLEKISNSVTIPNLTRSELKEVRVCYPGLEEQKYIIDLLQSAEKTEIQQKWIEQNCATYIVNIFMNYFRGYLYDSNTVTLNSCLNESILSGPRLELTDSDRGIYLVNSISSESGGIFQIIDENTKVEISNELLEQYRILPGDILLKRILTSNDLEMNLVDESIADAIIGSGVLRVRVDRRKILPEFLIIWMMIYQKNINVLSNKVGSIVDKMMISSINIPIVPIPIQEKFAEYYYCFYGMKKKLAKASKIAETIKNSLLTYAFAGKLSETFRKEFEIPDPDYSQTLYYYHIGNKKEISSRNISGTIKWDSILGVVKGYLINMLSEFQQAVLFEYYVSKESLPIHIMLKHLKAREIKKFKLYNIQDAIRATYLLESFGLVNRLPPQKIQSLQEDGMFIEDYRSVPITVQQFQFFNLEQEAEI